MMNIGLTGERVRENLKKDRADSECVGLMPIPFWPAAGINELRPLEVGMEDGTAAGDL